MGVSCTKHRKPYNYRRNTNNGGTISLNRKRKLSESIKNGRKSGSLYTQQTKETITTSKSNIRQVYNFSPKIIGVGEFGTIRMASLKTNKNFKVAVKTISKEKVNVDFDSIKKELEIMRSLDHPNIIKFYGTYQDQKYFHLVMEYCSGGSLLDKFIKMGKVKETEAARIMEKLFSVVEYLHSNGISHRDLKPENFLFVDKSKDSEIRIIDFGLSTSLIQMKNKGKNLNSLVGTPIYMAPEVILGSYDERCDNWSLGVILYQLLTGHTAFKGEKKAEVFKQILKGDYIMNTPEYQSLSDYAKHLISKFLIVNPNHRFTAVQALCHDWIESNSVQNQKEEIVNPLILKRLSNFKYPAYFAKEAMKIMVEQMTEVEIQDLKKQFHLIDIYKTGKITLPDMQLVLQDLLNYDTTDNQFQEMLLNLKSQTGEINYTDFISATLDRKLFFTKERLWTIFKHFDVDNSDFITEDNLKEAMARAGRKLPEEYIKNMIKEGDVLKNNRINFDEFLLLMDQDHKNKSFHSNGSYNDLNSLLSSPPKNSKLFKMELSEQDWKKIQEVQSLQNHPNQQYKFAYDNRSTY